MPHPNVTFELRGKRKQEPGGSHPPVRGAPLNQLKAKQVPSGDKLTVPPTRTPELLSAVPATFAPAPGYPSPFGPKIASYAGPECRSAVPRPWLHRWPPPRSVKRSSLRRSAWRPGPSAGAARLVSSALKQPGSLPCGS